MRGKTSFVAAGITAVAVASTAFAAVVKQDFTVGPGGIGGAAPKCANSKIATGGGFESGLNTAWDLNKLGPLGRSYAVGLKNDSGDPHSGTASALCFGEEGYRVKRKRIAFAVNAAARAVEKTAKARCPRGTKLAGGGYTATSPGSESAYVIESRPVGRSWKVRTVQSTAGSYVLRVRAVCDIRPGAKYEVEREALSEQLGRLAARGITGGILRYELEPTCGRGSRPTAGGYSNIGAFAPRWVSVSPRPRGFYLVGKQGFGSGGLPDGDSVGYAICRS